MLANVVSLSPGHTAFQNCLHARKASLQPSLSETLSFRGFGVSQSDQAFSDICF